MIQFTCPNCRSRLQAKPALVGQVRKCPKCAQPVLIAADSPAETDGQGSVPQAESQTEQAIILSEDYLPVFHPPTRLNRESHYLICDKTQIVATWENNGRSWMLRGGGGFVPARRNRDSLPAQGEFQLVELKFAMTPEGKRLVGIETYQLAPQWALTALAASDDGIIEKITGLGCLNRDQKGAIRLSFREQFMRPVWDSAAEVLDFLANADYHSSGAGGGNPCPP